MNKSFYLSLSNFYFNAPLDHYKLTKSCRSVSLSPLPNFCSMHLLLLEMFIFSHSSQLTTISLINYFSYKITGKVEYPLIKITPDIIRFQRIYPHAYDRCDIGVVNKSQAITTLQFGLEDFPEYLISKYADPLFR